MNNSYQKIYSKISEIPFGKVATYGQIARLAGLGSNARMVGYALHKTPKELDIPWHRVINSKGEISQLPNPDFSNLQQNLLESEGIVFGLNGKINLREFQWDV